MASDTGEGAVGDELDLIRETGRLFLRNLPYQATESDIAKLFEEYGELSEVHLVKDRSEHSVYSSAQPQREPLTPSSTSALSASENKHLALNLKEAISGKFCCRASQRSKGIALVQFMESSDAEAAHAALDGTIFQGRLMHILAAKPVPQSHQTEPVETLTHFNGKTSGCHEKPGEYQSVSERSLVRGCNQYLKR